MKKLIKQLKNNLPMTVFTDSEVILFASGSAHARYGQVKRNISSKDIIQLKRGVYCLGPKNLKQPINLFEVANKIYSPSYVSLESSLSFHGLIPEGVMTVTSISSKRSKEFENELGIFSYSKDQKFNFLGVERVVYNDSIFLMAEPTRALIDLIILNHIKSIHLDDWFDSLRIDQKELKKLISIKLLRQLGGIYKNQSVNQFIKNYRIKE